MVAPAPDPFLIWLDTTARKKVEQAIEPHALARMRKEWQQAHRQSEEKA